jgi:peptidoglycan/xylan/chitin deacetylase (PgdA/CDA1 family)
MMQAIIRDDDTSFFTQPEQLETIYGRLWERNIPVCIAVIPAQRADVRVQHRPGTPYDPGIPPQYRGQDREFPVTANRELCAFLNEKAREGLVEIVLHGYSHEYMEFVLPDKFTVDDEHRIAKKLVEGRQMLSETFPDARIKTFIAPYDRISQRAVGMVLGFGFNLCTASSNLAEISWLAEMGPYQIREVGPGELVYTCDEYLFTHRDPPQDCLANARERLQTASTLIVGNHYWCFYYDWGEVNAAMLECWYQFLDTLLAQSERRITTFSNPEDPRIDPMLSDSPSPI